MSASPSTASRNSTENNTTTTNQQMIELRQELNDKLNTLKSVCQDNKDKGHTITGQQQYIQSLMQQLAQLKLLNISPVTSQSKDDRVQFAKVTTNSNGYTTYNVIPNHSRRTN